MTNDNLMGPFGTPVSAHVMDVADMIDAEIAKASSDTDPRALKASLIHKVLANTDPHQRQELLWLKMGELIVPKVDEWAKSLPVR